MNNLNELKQNANVHNEQDYKCEICDKEFENNDGLKKHVKVVHNFVDENQCNICQKVFKIQSQLTKHMEISHQKSDQNQCKMLITMKYK